MPLRPLSEPERADILARSVALITARRTGMDDVELGRLIASELEDLTDADDAVTTMRFCYLVGQLTLMSAAACDHWNAAAAGTPADEWLGQAAAYAVAKAR